jgi:phage gp36-like protein
MEEAILIQLTDDADGGTADADVVTRSIADADGEIDGYVGSRHTVPLDPVPAIIRKCSVDIAIYNLYSRRNWDAPAVRKERYQAAIKFLELVARGTVSLGADDPDGAGGTRTAAELTTDANERVFTRDKLGSF